jgi:PAS domain S-box-containing protein
VINSLYMTFMTPTRCTEPREPPASQRAGWLARWCAAWSRSLRFRLLATGLAPLVLVFPLVLGVLVAVGGERANSLLASNLRSSLAGAGNYLNQVRIDAGLRLSQLARSERLMQRLRRDADPQELAQALRTAAEGTGLDYLVVATPDGRVLAASTGVTPGRRLPASHVIRQAVLGVATSAFERFEADELQAFSPEFAALARVEPVPDDGARQAPQTRGLLLNAAVHFPLAVDLPDAVLVGGILVNRNVALIEHMRAVLFPVGSLPGDVEGMTAVHLDTISVVTSRQQQLGQEQIGARAPSAAVQAVFERGETWVGRAELDSVGHVLAYAPLLDGEGRRVGMLAAGYPDGPYQRTVWLLLGMVAALLAAAMLMLSLLFVRSGRELTQRLDRISHTMAAVRQGARQARVGTPLRDDELGQLARDFDVLLETLALQDAAQREAQQAIADEASRRRALFEHERDGVVILNPDGSVFEANPKGAAMLGCSAEQLLAMHVADWDATHDRAQLQALLDGLGSEGRFFETVHRRRDGSTYAAEVSLSTAEWGDRRFIFMLMRDISERKAVEAELQRYRHDLERRVEQRTQELHARSEQLDAIFALSPDGFVSFDRERRVVLQQPRLQPKLTGLATEMVLGLEEACSCTACDSRCDGPVEASRLDQAGEAHHDEADRQLMVTLSAAQAHRVVELACTAAGATAVSQVLHLRDVTRETEVDRHEERVRGRRRARAAHAHGRHLRLFGTAASRATMPRPQRQKDLLDAHPPPVRDALARAQQAHLRAVAGKDAHRHHAGPLVDLGLHRQRVGDRRPRTSRMGWPLSVSTPARSVAVPPRPRQSGAPPAPRPSGSPPPAAESGPAPAPACSRRRCRRSARPGRPRSSRASAPRRRP